MRMTRLATAFALASLVGLPAGTALAGAAPPAPVLNGAFVFQDDTQGANNCANVNFGGTTFQADGVVTGVATTGETVTVTYSQDFVDSAKAKAESGSISQKLQGDFDITIDDGVNPPATLTSTADKCRVQAKVNNAGADARVKVTCEVGKDLADIGASAAQLTVIQDAFTDRKDMKLSGKNAVVTLKGASLTGTCP